MYPTSCHKRSEATRSNCYWNHGHEWSVSWHPLLQTVDLQSDLLLGLRKSGGDGGCSLGESPLRRRLPHTSSPSSPLTAAGQAGRLWPTATTQPLLLPATPPPPSCWASPMPQCTRDPGREPLEAKWPPEDDPAGASPHPLPQQCHMAAPTRRAVHPAAETQGRVAAGTG